MVLKVRLLLPQHVNVNLGVLILSVPYIEINLGSSILLSS